MTEADARKGSYTQAIKKSAAIIAGTGRQAYEGTLDDDNAAIPARAATDRPRPAPGHGGGNGHNGRITVEQLEELKALVAGLGSEWPSFRSYIREERGVQVEYLDSVAGNEIIADLTSRTTRRGSNGAAQGAA